MDESTAGAIVREVRARSTGAAWLAATELVLEEGSPSFYEGHPIVELPLLDVVVDAPDIDDGVIAEYGDQERLEWMHANFTDLRPVEELGGADSYATRLYNYNRLGRDQIAWVIERLSKDPESRSAIVTTLQPLTDSTYIPCVSLLHFWRSLEGIDLLATAHSIDLGTKGYANLVELVNIQSRVVSELDAAFGRVVLRITSAHVYKRDIETTREFLRQAHGAGHLLNQ